MPYILPLRCLLLAFLVGGPEMITKQQEVEVAGGNAILVAKPTTAGLGIDEFAHWGHDIDADGQRVIVVNMVGGVRIFAIDGERWRVEKEFDLGIRARCAVAIDGDRAVIGIGRAPGGGALWELRLESGSWSEPVRIEGPPEEWRDSGFGTRIRLSGDRLLVGSRPWPDNPAFVLVRVGGSWRHEAQLPTIPYSIDLTKDRAIIGDAQAGKFGGRGNAVIYRRVGDEWVEEARLTDPGGKRGDRFGRSVAIRGRLAAVGAPNAAGRRGRVSLYRFLGDRWELLSSVEGATKSHGFGSEIALHDRLFVVTAPWTSKRPPDSSPTYLFPLDGGSIGPVAWITDPARQPRDHFGTSLAVSERFVAIGTNNACRDAEGKDYSGDVSLATLPPSLRPGD